MACQFFTTSWLICRRNSGFKARLGAEITMTEKTFNDGHSISLVQVGSVSLDTWKRKGRSQQGQYAHLCDCDIRMLLWFVSLISYFLIPYTIYDDKSVLSSRA